MWKPQLRLSKKIKQALIKKPASFLRKRAFFILGYSKFKRGVEFAGMAIGIASFVAANCIGPGFAFEIALDAGGEATVKAPNKKELWAARETTKFP